ncbi:Aste57867_1941 [Aphanomyces stellatus]|nr:hypothetical protein As57867_001939 [Aphanomyces stellatus]VFT79146.1 Aste57867_1941 [Aphanomyces stellatus]
MNWVFWGEEYLRSMQLWTRGYDLYSPSRHGHVVFHNWSDDKGMKKRFSDNVTQMVTQEQHDKEVELAFNRLRLVLGLPFYGDVDALEIATYHGGHVRSVEQFLAFSGISNVDPTLDRARCEQLHWVPFAIPEIVEALLPGWTMRPPSNDDFSGASRLGLDESLLLQTHNASFAHESHLAIVVVAMVSLGLVWLVYNSVLRKGATDPNHYVQLVETR